MMIVEVQNSRKTEIDSMENPNDTILVDFSATTISLSFCCILLLDKEIYQSEIIFGILVVVPPGSSPPVLKASRVRKPFNCGRCSIMLRTDFAVGFII
ncbi:hypothetical protein ACTXT7_006228 [Hymenolepis weldensis]